MSAARRPAVLMIAYTNYETDPRVIRAAEAAAEGGFDVDVLVLRRDGQPAEETVAGVRILRLAQERFRGRSVMGYLSAYGSFFLRSAAAAARLHFAKRYCIVHVHNMPDALVFAAAIPKLFGAKVILDIHDPMPETFGAKYERGYGRAISRTLLFLERLSVGFATRTVTVNEPVRTEVLLKHGYGADAIDVVANFADDRLFRPLPPPVLNGRVQFVFHGTILERYGLRTLVEAVSLVRHKDKIHVRIIGEGDFSQQLQKLIDDRGLNKVIEFANRMYPLSQIPAVLADCHVGLVPLDITPISDFALPLKLVEYTCLGIPSVTVRTTAITHYLRPDECMLYDPGDAVALAKIVDDIAQDPGRLSAYRDKLEGVRERVSWTREKQKFVTMLHELAGHRPAANTVNARQTLQ